MEQKVERRDLSPKERLILDAALALLIETGDAGLTMRKLAERAEMRLSNVQYYFKTRDDVLIAMVAGYFEECTENLKILAQQSNASTIRDRIRFLVQAVLVHGLEISDMSRAFREIWAISSRSDLIDECLMEYYRRFSKVVVDFAFEGKTDAAFADRLTTLLVPYFEGYSITARALPLDMHNTANLLTDLALSISVTGAD